MARLQAPPCCMVLITRAGQGSTQSQATRTDPRAQESTAITPTKFQVEKPSPGSWLQEPWSPLCGDLENPQPLPCCPGCLLPPPPQMLCLLAGAPFAALCLHCAHLFGLLRPQCSGPSSSGTGVILLHLCLWDALRAESSLTPIWVSSVQIGWEIPPSAAPQAGQGQGP